MLCLCISCLVSFIPEANIVPGGAIGAGLFVGAGGALNSGGPGSLVICFIIIG